MPRHLQLKRCQATCNCQHVKKARSKNKKRYKREKYEKRVKMYTNDQAHRFTAVAAFHVGLQGWSREVPYDTK